MSIPREFIEQLLARIDIIDLINTHLPLRKKSGSNYFARCPFHQEKSASFSVSQPKQFYYCFGCGAHGNAIDFMMQHDNLSFPEAIELLASQAAMEVPKQAGAPKEQSLNDLYTITTQAAAFYYQQMRASSRAIDYLKKRQIQGKTAQQFQIGYASSAWSHLLDKLGKTEADKKKLLETGLIIKKQEGAYYDRFRDRIIFPIHDYRGRIIGFGGRILDQGEPKYLNSPETPIFQKGHGLYGLYQALKANRKLEKVLVVEGYMDVISLFQHDITYAVATLGTATTAHHIHRLSRYTADIIFCFDGDKAGRTAASRALQVLLPIMNDQMQIRFLFLPEGEDPDTLVMKEGKATFEARLKDALSLSNFFFQNLGGQYDIANPEGRARFASAALAEIKQITDGLFQSLLIEELAKRTRIDSKELIQQLKTGRDTKTTSAALPTQTPDLVLAPALRSALMLLLQQPSLAKLARPLLSQQNGAELFNHILSLSQNQANMTTGELMEHFRGHPQAGSLAKLANMPHALPETGIQNEFLGALKQLQTLEIEQEINYLLAKMAQGTLSDQEKLALSDKIAKKKNLAS